jgi:hypothetical protein
MIAGRFHIVAEVDATENAFFAKLSDYLITEQELRNNDYQS